MSLVGPLFFWLHYKCSPIDAHTSSAHPSNQATLEAELKAPKSIQSLEAAILKAEAYGIDTKAAKELLKVRGVAMWRGPRGPRACVDAELGEYDVAYAGEAGGSDSD